MHDTGAALRGVASDMSAGQAQIFAQELHQQRARVDIGGRRIAVHDQRNSGHRRSLWIHCGTSERSFKNREAMIWAIPTMSNLAVGRGGVTTQTLSLNRLGEVRKKFVGELLGRTTDQ